MRSRAGLVRSGAAALLLLAAAATAAHPLFAPSRDVSVQYRLESPDANAAGGKTTNALRLRVIGGGQLIRLDNPASGAYLLIDRARKTATVVDPKIHAFMSRPLNPRVASGLLLLDPEATYQRAGSARVAGYACDLWKIGPGRAGGSVCVTADGVVLSRIEGSRPAHQARLTALSVAYEAEPKALFAPPPGFQDLSAQKALPGSAPPTANPR